MSTLAILIDPWSDDQSSIYQDSINHIVEFCNKQDEITTIALSAYEMSNLDNSGYYIKSWHENSDQYFNLQTKWDFLRKSWNKILWKYDPIVHPKIVNMHIRSNQTKMTMLNDYHVLYYCNYINTSIKKIYFMGRSWDLCVKYRPIGWLSIASLQHHNLLSKQISLCVNPYCVYDSQTNQYAQPTKPWSQIDDYSYQLNLNDIDW